MKIKTGLYQQYATEQKEKENQQKLQEKYNIEDPTVKVVEKSNMFKFLVRLTRSLLAWLARIALLILAGIGLIAIIYPSCRSELILTLYDILEQIKFAFNI